MCVRTQTQTHTHTHTHTHSHTHTHMHTCLYMSITYSLTLKFLTHIHGQIRTYIQCMNEVLLCALHGLE